MADITAHLRRNLVQAEQLGQTERAKRIRARLAGLERPDKPVDKMNKSELVAEAEARGVEIDESLTKAEIVAVLSEED